MQHTVQILPDLYWVGASERRLARFENMYPLTNGVTYNAYLLTDAKTVLLDTCDASVAEQFFENVAYVLGDRALDYIVVNHMEPDHAATLAEALRRYPEATVVTTAKSETLIGQFFSESFEARIQPVKEGDTLACGAHTLTFVMAPMVHWPEVMVTYDATSKTLFSADAFGTFGAFNGSIYADSLNAETGWLPEARRYYANIVGKYGPQVTALLKKAAGLELERVCPLHGPIWRANLDWLFDKYAHWGSYTPEDKGVLIVAGSVYGHTMQAAQILAAKLAENGVENVALYDAANTDCSLLVAEAFRISHIVFASATYNNGIFTPVETLLTDLAAHNLQNRKVAIVENGSWAPASGRLIREKCAAMKNVEVLEPIVTLRSALREGQQQELAALAKAVAASVKK